MSSLLSFTRARAASRWPAARMRSASRSQEVRLIELHVGADAVPVGCDGEEMAEHLRIPSPGELQLGESAVVGLELRGQLLARLHRIAHSCHFRTPSSLHRYSPYAPDYQKKN